MLKTWETLRFKGLPDYICKDAGFIEKVSIAKVDIGNIERTFCDDESSKFLYDLIKGNNFETKQLQALCGDFEHCVPEDGEELLEIYDFIKDAKKDNLTNKALEFYADKNKNWWQKLKQEGYEKEQSVQKFWMKKEPEFRNAFFQEYFANITVNTLKYYLDSIDSPSCKNLGTCLVDIIFSLPLYESSFRNALNTFGTSQTNGTWSYIGIANDAFTGINYMNIFDSSKSMSEKLVRTFYEATYNIVKNVLNDKRNNLIGKEIPYINTIGEQALFDGLETYSEDMFVEFVNRIYEIK